MNFKLRTEVNGNYIRVMDLFDLDLFKALKPIGVKMEIVEFTGSKTGDTVALKFLTPIKAEWVSKITEHGQDDTKAYFIDEGEVIPFPLRHWMHKHVVEKIDEANSCILDDITFSSGNKLLDIFLYLPLYLSFYPRKKIYRSYFSETT